MSLYDVPFLTVLLVREVFSNISLKATELFICLVKLVTKCQSQVRLVNVPLLWLAMLDG